MQSGLYVCATPIGNLQDMTLRVAAALKEVDLILAEDTRHTRKLLTHFEINTPLRSLHEHNEYEQIPALLAELAAGAAMALVSDAGLPAVSDPGAELIKAAREQGIPVTVLPGPSAVTTALILSGLASGEGFSFIGFLPRGSKQRFELLEKYSQLEHPLVCFESPHRLVSALADLEAVFGAREVAVCRELTKVYEEVIRFPLPELRTYFSHHAPRGEITLVIAPAPPLENTPEAVDSTALQAAWRDLQALGMNKKEVQETLQERYGLSRNELYALLLNKDQ
jgi:16S rRNA (cytidine1402-2'-O)-methyltransferase